MSQARTTIDAWMQHPGQRWIDDEMFASLRRWKPGPFSETAPALEVTIEAMDAAGVDRGMLCAWHGPAGAMITNEDVAAAGSAYPDRFIGVGSVDLTRPRVAVVELRRCVTERGFRALRVLPWLWGLPPDARRYYPLYAACCGLGITFCTQVGHAGPPRASDPGRPVPYLNHARRHPAALVDYLRGHGRRKVIFGSNHPFWPARDCLAGLHELNLDEPTTQTFLHDNAAAAFALS